MPAAVDILQQFASDDLFDAELGEDSDGGQNGDETFEENGSKSPNARPDLFEDEQSADEEAVDHSSDEESRPRKKKERKKDSRKKSPKPRRIKKADSLAIHSESQRLVRESLVKLPYHMPTVQPITHFLRRVPGLVDEKEANRNTRMREEKVTSASPPNSESPLNGNGNLDEIPSPLAGDTATPTEAADGVNGVKATTPKLSAASDPFFLDATPTNTAILKARHGGVQSLMQRFMKHASKPQEKAKASAKLLEKEESKIGEVTNGATSEVADDKLSTNTPGARLQLLKEQLQKKMKVQRAEIRKIQESQRKLDNEEMSEEEEEEENVTDEDDDNSDFELDKWNEDDERKQEEGDSDLDELEDDEGKKENNAFIEDEADESDNADDGGYDIDSGSEGDISDDNDDDDEVQSVFSDYEEPLTTKGLNKKKANESKKVTVNGIEEQTLDLFNDSRSQSDAKERSDFRGVGNASEEKESGASFGSLCLRLDSVEDGDDTAFNFPSSPVNSRLKPKESSSKTEKSLTYISELSQESSQSSTRGLVSSELGESANSLEASSDSSRFPPGQGDSVGKTGGISSGRDTPELFSSFSKLRSIIGASADGGQQTSKKPGKLSQLTLPIEDSQDLFDDESDRNMERSKQEKTGTEASSDFHFALDEDTQLTQILNTQGFINSSKKSKSKAKKLFEDMRTNSTQPHLNELIGLCSGSFSDGDDTQSIKNTRSEDATTRNKAFSQFGTQAKQSTMGELLGLCSGKFSDDEEKATDEEFSESRGKGASEMELGEDTATRSKTFSQFGTQAKQSTMSELLGLCSGRFSDDEEKVTDEETSESRGKGASEIMGDQGGKDDGGVGEKGADEDESDPEEMVLKRKYGKKYDTKKRGIFDKRNFLEEEAELSGSDIGSDEDEDIATDDDVVEEDSDAEELPSNEELQKQINKVHMKSMYDQDDAELRAVKEMFLPDGDLYTDGQGRKRHFRWRGIDENSQFDFFGNKELWGNEEEAGAELISEEEIQRRKERYERETFLREEMGKEKKDFIDIDESSQNILNIIKDTSSQLPEVSAPSKPQAIVNRKSNVTPVFMKTASRKGSFLNHSKTTLSRLSSLTSNTPNASSTTRGFVFQSVSPANKDQTKAKKMQRTNSLIEAPASKKPRLDRSLSDSNSVFAML